MEYIKPGSVGDVLTAINKNFSIIHNSVLRKGVPGETGPAGSKGDEGDRGNLLHIAMVANAKKNDKLKNDVKDTNILTIDIVNTWVAIDEKRIEFLSILEPVSVGLIKGDLIILDGSSNILIFDGIKFVDTGFTLNPSVAEVLRKEVADKLNPLAKKLFDEWAASQTGGATQVFKKYKTKISDQTLRNLILTTGDDNFTHNFYGFNDETNRTTTVAGDMGKMEKILATFTPTGVDMSSEYGISDTRGPAMIVLQNDSKSGLAIGSYADGNTHGIRDFAHIYKDSSGALYVSNKYFEKIGSDNNTRYGYISINDDNTTINNNLSVLGNFTIPDILEATKAPNKVSIKGGTGFAIEGLRAGFLLETDASKNLVTRYKLWELDTNDDTIPNLRVRDRLLVRKTGSIDLLDVNTDTGKVTIGGYHSTQSTDAAPDIWLRFRNLSFTQKGTTTNDIADYAIPVLTRAGMSSLSTAIFDRRLATFQNNTSLKEWTKSTASDYKYKSGANTADSIPNDRKFSELFKGAISVTGSSNGNYVGTNYNTSSDGVFGNYVLTNRHLEMIGDVVENIRMNNDVEHERFASSSSIITYIPKTSDITTVTNLRADIATECHAPYIDLNTNTMNALRKNVGIGQYSKCFGYSIRTARGDWYRPNDFRITESSWETQGSSVDKHYNCIQQSTKVNQFYGIKIPKGYVPCCIGFVTYFAVPVKNTSETAVAYTRRIYRDAGFLHKRINGVMYVKQPTTKSNVSLATSVETLHNMEIPYTAILGCKVENIDGINTVTRDYRMDIASTANKLAHAYSASNDIGMKLSLQHSQHIYSTFTQLFDITELAYEPVANDISQTHHNLVDRLHYKPGFHNPLKLMKYNAMSKQMTISGQVYNIYHIFYMLNSVTGLHGIEDVRCDRPRINGDILANYTRIYVNDRAYLSPTMERMYLYNNVTKNGPNVNTVQHHHLMSKNSVRELTTNIGDTIISSIALAQDIVNRRVSSAVAVATTGTTSNFGAGVLPGMSLATSGLYFDSNKDMIGPYRSLTCRNNYNGEQWTHHFNKFYSQELQQSLYLNTLPFSNIFTAYEVDPHGDIDGRNLPNWSIPLSTTTFA